MSKNSENTQFQNATASTLKAISGNTIEEREIKFSGSSSYLSSKEVRLPVISKELDNSELCKVRGEADKIALKIKYHDPVLHSKYVPSSDLSSQIFQLAEESRIEAVGSKNLLGIKKNLQNLVTEKFKETILPIPGGEDKEALVNALHLVIREKITGSKSPPNTSLSLEKWRPWINSKIGNLLNQLAENTNNQEVFAKYTKELLSALHADIGERDPNNDGENEDSEDNNPDENEENDSSAESQSDNDEDAGLDGGSDSQENEQEIQGETQDADDDNEDEESEGEIAPNPLSGHNLGTAKSATWPPGT